MVSRGRAITTYFAIIWIIGAALLALGIGYSFAIVNHNASSSSPFNINSNTNRTQGQQQTVISTTTIQKVVTSNETIVKNDTVTKLVTTTVTSISTYVPHGSESLLSSQTEVIPGGSSAITVPSSSSGWNLGYNGYMEVSYSSQNNIHLAYNYGSTSITTPSSASESNLILPVTSGNLKLNIVNDNCEILFGCQSDTLTISVTYVY
jgi:hypothetical protein